VTIYRASFTHDSSNATFTLEDQKYFAYLDEKEKLEKNSFLSGAASYDHVLVDEFQDIKPLDLALIKAIAERSRAGLTIVGDDDQAIYEWRGATPEYILDPGRFFGTPFDTFTLATNYRSPKNIVDFCQSLIAHNIRRVAKSIKANRAEDATIEILKTSTLSLALELTFDEVKTVVGAGNSPSKVAIIGRKRSQLIPYQVFFASRDVSFCAAEDLQVFMSAAFDRLLRLMMIKNRSNLTQMRTQVIDDVIDLSDLVKRYPLNKKYKDSLRKYLTQSGANTVVKGLVALSKYDGPLKGSNPETKMSLVMADAITKFLLAKTVSKSLLSMGAYFEGQQLDFGKAQDDIFFAAPPFLQLAEYAVRYGDDYGQFVEDIERAKDQLAYVPPFEDEEKASSAESLWKRPVHLMTALRAKGKEFESVIILDVNDGIWPHKNATTLDQREAERRVFYVAFTRAKKKVLMLVSKTLANKPASPSPYIEELGLNV
jgi:DNA helicase II / ATP-dependent DNA helicase PcrA